MDWSAVGWSTILGAVSGGLAALVAGLVVRKPENRRPSHLVALALAFVALFSLGRAYALPQVRAMEGRYRAGRILETNPVFSLLAARDSQVRARFEALLEDLGRRRASKQEMEAEVFAFGQSLVAPVLGESLAHASDAALVEYTEAMLATLDRLRERNGEHCYAFLTGQVPEGQSISRLLSDADGARMSAAMAAVVESALTAPTQAVHPSQVGFRLTLLAERMRSLHGDELVRALASVGQPLPDADPAAMCAATIELYRTALSFPAGERETMLRCLFGPTGA